MSCTYLQYAKYRFFLTSIFIYIRLFWRIFQHLFAYTNVSLDMSGVHERQHRQSCNPERWPLQTVACWIYLFSRTYTSLLTSLFIYIRLLWHLFSHTYMRDSLFRHFCFDKSLSIHVHVSYNISFHIYMSVLTSLCIHIRPFWHLFPCMSVIFDVSLRRYTSLLTYLEYLRDNTIKVAALKHVVFRQLSLWYVSFHIFVRLLEHLISLHASFF